MEIILLAYIVLSLYPEFKSHYVVWKFFVWAISLANWGLFKSHYVVWKFTIYHIDCIPYFLFKSHYVVWKWDDVPGNYLTQEGLNRTM